MQVSIALNTKNIRLTEKGNVFFGLDILNSDTDCLPEEIQDVTWQRTSAGGVRIYPCPKEHLGKIK